MRKWTNALKKKAVSVPLLFGITFCALYFMAKSILTSVELAVSKNLLITICGLTAAAFVLVANLRKNHAYKDIEYGSAKFGGKKEVRGYRDKKFSNNIILSETEFLSMNGRKTRINNHVLVDGGSGSGKSRFYVMPNIMQMNASYILTDPSGELLRNTGKMLKENGYRIKVFDAKDLKYGMRFNPFHYFTEIKDIRRFVEMLMSNTSGDVTNPQHNEDFWVKAERTWLMAHIAYLLETCSPSEQTMNSVVRLLDESRASEEDEGYVSAVDILFENLRKENPESFAAKQYSKYKQAAGKTAKSILVSVGVRLSDWDIPEVAAMFSDDDLELGTFGDQKTALFILLDDADTTYSYLASLVLDCAFMTLKNAAVNSPDHHLKIPVRVIMDEFANVGRFPKMKTLIAVLRKYHISIEIILQNINQLKSLYKDDWVTIEGNCDTTLFLGGKGEDNTKYVSNNLLGKATIETTSHGGTGNGGLGYSSYNDNQQQTGRNLLDETEVSRIGTDECIVSIKGTPFKSKKYNPAHHRRYKQTGMYSSKNDYILAFGGREEKKDGFYYVTEINLQEAI